MSEVPITDEVERLRLTEAEREAILWAANTLCVGWDDLKPDDKDKSRAAAGTLREILERQDDAGSAWSKDKCELMKEFLPVECLVDAKHDPVGPTSGDRIRGMAIGRQRKP